MNPFRRHNPPPPPVPPTLLDVIIGLLTQITMQGELIMASLEDIKAAVEAERTVEAGVIELLGHLASDLQAAIAGNDPAAMQAVVDSINANAAALSAAVVANTPASAPPAPPAPPAPAAP